MYAQIKTNQHSGIYEVVQIIGGIVAVDINGSTYDCYLKNGEIIKFCTADGKNYLSGTNLKNN